MAFVHIMIIARLLCYGIYIYLLSTVGVKGGRSYLVVKEGTPDDLNHSSADTLIAFRSYFDDFDSFSASQCPQVFQDRRPRGTGEADPQSDQELAACG